MLALPLPHFANDQANLSHFFFSRSKCRLMSIPIVNKFGFCTSWTDYAVLSFHKHNSLRHGLKGAFISWRAPQFGHWISTFLIKNLDRKILLKIIIEFGITCIDSFRICRSKSCATWKSRCSGSSKGLTLTPHCSQATASSSSVASKSSNSISSSL